MNNNAAAALTRRWLEGILSEAARLKFDDKMSRAALSN